MAGESWEELPDVVDTAAPATSWEDLPDADAAAWEGLADAEPVDAPSVQGFTVDDVTEAAAPQRRREDAAQLKQLFNVFADENADDASKTLRISRQLGLTPDDVRPALKEFERTAKVVGFDADKYVREYPMLTEMMLRHPHTVPMVATHEELGPIVRAINAATDVFDFALGIQSDADKAEEAAWAEQFAADPDVAMKTDTELAAGLRRLKELEQRDAPKKVMKADTGDAAMVRELSEAHPILGGAMAAALRAGEQYDALQVSKLRFERMVALGMGDDDTAREKAFEIQERLLKSQAADYGDDTGIALDVRIGMQAFSSQVEVLGQSLKFAGAGATAGAVTGGAAGAVLGRGSPAVIGEGALLGARTFGGAGAKVGAVYGSFVLETGETFEALENLETDDHKRLTTEEAIGGAVVAGSIKAGLEFLSFSKSTAPVRNALANRLIDGIKYDPTLRRMLWRVAKEYAASVATEGLTEGLQTAVDQVARYVSASMKDGRAQKGDVLDWNEINQSVEAGAFGAMLLGGATSAGGVALDIGLQSLQRDRSDMKQRAIAPLGKLAQLDIAKDAPKELAEAIQSNNPDLTHVYVDAEQTLRLLQKDGVATFEDAVAKVTELAGEEAGKSLVEAGTSTEGKIAVPLEQFIGKFGSSELGKALLAADTTADPASLTPRKKKQRSAEIEKEASDIAAREVAKLEEGQQFEAYMERFQASAVDLMARDGKSRADARRQARVVTALHRALLETQMSDFGKTFSELFPQAPVELNAGDERTTGESSKAPLESAMAAAAAMSREQQLDTAFRDDLSPLLSRRGWDATERTPETQVAVLSVPDVKAINDDPNGGHDTTNRMLGLLGDAVSRSTQNFAARNGTDFLVEVKDEAELEALRTAVQAAAPAGVQVLAHMGQNVEQAYATEKSSTDARRALAPTDPQYVLPRGQTRFDTTTLSDQSFVMAERSPSRPLGKLVDTQFGTPADFATNVLQSRTVPGALSKAGFERTPAKKYTLALDMRGLADVNKFAEAALQSLGIENKKLAQRLGDQLLARVGEAARAAGGEDFYFAHLSGDELAAKSDSLEELEGFEQRLVAQLKKVKVSATFKGQQVLLTPLLRSGIAEGGYGKADRVLNERKRTEPAVDKSGSALDRLRRIGVADEGTAQRPADNRQRDGRPDDAGRGSRVEGVAREGQSEPTGVGSEEVALPDWVTEGIDQDILLVEDQIKQREEGGPLRAQEREALEAGFNRNDVIARAREHMEKYAGSRDSAKALELRAAKEAFLRWVLNEGGPLVPKGFAVPPGAYAADESIIKEVRKWARDQNVIDPADGIAEIVTRDAEPIGKEFRRERKKMARTPYERAVQDAQREQFEKDVLGRVRLRQDDAAAKRSANYGLAVKMWRGATPAVRAKYGDANAKQPPAAFVDHVMETRGSALSSTYKKDGSTSAAVVSQNGSNRHGRAEPPATPGKAEKQGRAFDSVDLRNGRESLEEYGLEKPAEGEFNTVREIYEALQARQRDLFGRIARNDHSPEARAKIAEAVARIVENELGAANRKTSGKGWYTAKYDKAIEHFTQAFPELKKPLERLKFTAFIAITSNGQKVSRNFEHAAELWEEYRKTGKLPKKVKASRAQSMIKAFSRLQSFINTHGEAALPELLKVRPVAEHREKARELGMEFTSSFDSTEEVPFASVIIGPKIGTFFGNLAKLSGFLTLDMWAMRTFNTLRGDIITEVSRTGLDRFKAMAEAEHGKLTDKQAMRLAETYRDAADAKNYKNTTPLEKAGNELWKQQNEKFNQAPLTGADRAFLIQAVKDARVLLKQRGHGDVSVADIQAISWFYEQRLVRQLGGRVKSDVSYDEAAKAWLDERVEADRRGDARGGRRTGDRADARRANARDGQRADAADERGVAPDGNDTLASRGVTRLRQDEVEQAEPAKKMSPNEELKWRVESLMREHLLVEGFKWDTPSTDERALQAWLDKAPRHIILSPGGRRGSGFMPVGVEGVRADYVLDDVPQFATREAAEEWVKGNSYFTFSTLRQLDLVRANLGANVLTENGVPDFKTDRLMPDEVRFTESNGRPELRLKEGEDWVEMGTFFERTVEQMRQAGASEEFANTVAQYRELINAEHKRDIALDTWRDTNGGIIEQEALVPGGVVYSSETGKAFDITKVEDEPSVVLPNGTRAAAKPFTPGRRRPFARYHEFAAYKDTLDSGHADVVFTDPSGQKWLLSNAGFLSAPLVSEVKDDPSVLGIESVPPATLVYVKGRELPLRFVGEAQGEFNNPEGTDDPYYTTLPPPAPVPQAKLADRWFQTDDETTPDEAKKPPLGYADVSATRAAQSTINTFFNRKANVSTFAHEASHAYLEMLADLAARPDAPARTRETWALAMKWLGIRDRVELTVAQHEKWARSWEAWLLDGKAPSAGLAGVFQSFKLWLTNIYRSIRGIPGAEFNEEVRTVFERLVATDDEIQRMAKKRGPPLEGSERPAGMSDAEWQAKLDEQRTAVAEATRRAELMVLKSRQRTTEAWWKAGLEKAREQAAEEYERLPARRAQLVLQGKLPGLPGGPLKLDAERVNRAVGKRRAPGLQTEEGGTNPDLVAGIAGYPDGESMLRDLVDLRPKEAWVEFQAEFSMNLDHPDVLEERTELRKAIDDGLQDYTESRILNEWAALKKRVPALGGAPLEAIKLAAGKVVATRPFRALHPARVLTEQRQAAERKAKAGVTGAWDKAAEAAREEALKAAQYRETQKALEELDALEKLTHELSRVKRQAKLGKASPLYRDAVAYLLQSVGEMSRSSTPLTDATLTAAVDQLNGDAVIIGEPEWLAPVRAALARGVELRSLTVTEGRALSDALKQLAVGARQRSEVLLDNATTDREAVRDEVLREIASTLPERAPRKERAAMSPVEKVMSAANWLSGYLLSPIDLVRDLTGNDIESTLFRAVVLPLRRAKHREADLLKKTVEPVVKLFDAMPKEVRKRLGDDIDGAGIFTSHEAAYRPSKRFELLMMALNVGNAGNLQRLLDGRRITDDQVQKALDMLTPEEVAWVQSVYDAIESLKDEAFALEERMTGLKPEAVTATPRNLKGGVLRGGYFPAVYVPGASMQGERQQANALAALFDPTYTRASTPHSHLKQRADKVSAMISLDPNIIMRHLAQTVHDIAFREAVTSVGRLLLDDGSAKELNVNQAMKDRLGEEKVEQIHKWLKDIGGATGADVSKASQLMTWLKGNMGPALLGFNAPVAIGDLASLAVVLTPATPLKARHLGGGMLEALSGEARKAARETSAELRGMQDNMVRQFREQMRDVRTPPSALTWMRDNAFFFQETVARLITTPIWMGAYKQARADGKEHQQAVIFADDVLTETFPSHSDVERAAVLRDKSAFGALTMFYGYLSKAYRNQHRILAPLHTQAFQSMGLLEKGATAGKVAAGLFAFYVAYQVLAELGMGKGPEAGDRDDEEPESDLLAWRNWLMRKLLISPLALLPLPVASAVEQKMLGKRVSERASPLASYVALLADVAFNWDKEVGQKFLDASRALGIGFGFPVAPITKTGGYLIDQANEEPEPGNPVSGVIYGKKRAATPLSPSVPGP
jgi:GGDEF domain-containing protein